MTAAKLAVAPGIVAPNATNLVLLFPLHRISVSTHRLVCHWHRDAGGRLVCAWSRKYPPLPSSIGTNLSNGW
jgi:hypothetical protein